MTSGRVRCAGWALVASAFAISGCHPARGHVHYIGPETGFMRVSARLDCPDQSGDLMRSSAAADGLSCVYSGPNEETVTLVLQPLAGATAQALLAKVETQLKADAGPNNVAAPKPPSPPNAKDWDAGGGNQADGDDKDDDEGPSSKVESRKDVSNDDHTKIDLPGLHISTDGDRADVRIAGVSIHADGDNAQVHAGWWGRDATIEGHNGGATIRIGRADQNGVDAMLILASDQPGPTGYRTIGYVAKGPAAGPLVIATFKSKGGDRSEHDLAGDGLKALVKLNVHQGLGWFSDSTASADRDAKP